MRTYIAALMLLVTLGLVSCGGGNEGASTGTPVVAQATIASWCSNFNFLGGGTGSTNICGCANSSTFGGSGPALNQSQENACTTAIYSADNAQCSALGGLTVSYKTAENYLLEEGRLSCLFPAYASPPNPWTVYSNGGCVNSINVLNRAQLRACYDAIGGWVTIMQCTALGGSFSPITGYYPYGNCNIMGQ